jgi:hypothetical protein
MRSDGSGSGSGLLHSSVFAAPKSSTSQPLQKFKSSPLNVNGDGSVHVPLPLSNTYKKTPLTFNGAKNNVRAKESKYRARTSIIVTSLTLAISSVSNLSSNCLITVL